MDQKPVENVDSVNTKLNWLSLFGKCINYNDMLQQGIFIMQNLCKAINRIYYDK